MHLIMLTENPTGINCVVDARQQAYLEAMGVSIWALRTAKPADHGVGLKLGPGRGSVLLICENDIDSASKLATDIGRAMGRVPVWAWPADNADSVVLKEVVNDHLFTTVAVFGKTLAKQFFGQKLPATLNSASLVVLPAMPELERHADARRLLWSVLCQSGMVAGS